MGSLPFVAPKVSIVIPCYNQAEFLPEAVESVLKQVYRDYEIVIVNDGSTDNTKEVARDIVMYNPHVKIKVLEQDNQGLSAARNNGIRDSAGEYILPLDADDLIRPDMLEKMTTLLDSDPSVAIAYCDVIHFGMVEERIVAAEYNFTKLIHGNQLNYCSLFRRKAWETVGGYKPLMKWGYEDWEFWISCGEKGFFAKRIPKFLFMYRTRYNSMYAKALANDRELRALIVLNHPKLYAKEEVAKCEQLFDCQSACSSSDTEAIQLDRQGDSAKVGPLVSVIVPTYNRTERLEDALKSILSQTYWNIEIVVINDGGLDVSEIIDDLNRENRIVSVQHEENRGLAAARNSGLRVARGKYIAYLDDDDIFYPKHVETLVGFLEQSGAKVAYTDSYQVFEAWIEDRYVVTGKKITYSQDFDRWQLLVKNYIPVINIMHRKDILEETGVFDESLDTHEDWDLWIRVSGHYEFSHIKAVTAEFRTRSQDSITSTNRLSLLKTLRIIHSRYAHLVPHPAIFKQQKQFDKLSHIKGSRILHRMWSKRRTFMYHISRREFRTILVKVYQSIRLGHANK
jgi:glycosyltransferase involved in cell wall biosynthesis